MQDGVGESDVKSTEVEKTLSGMGQLETLVLGIYVVSLRWYSIVMKNYTSALINARHAIVTCGPSVTWCLCVYVSKWRSTCWECGLM